MKKTRKILALLLAAVMVFAMSISAFAATGDPNFTKSDSCEWSTAVAAGQTVTLKVGPADSSYNYTGFTTAADAEATTWSLNTGVDNCTYTTGSIEDVNHAGNACYAATITITPNAGFYGPISVHAVPANPSSAWTSVDMTAYVEASAPVATASNVTVFAADARSTADLVQVKGICNVNAINAVTDHGFAASRATAKSYPTALNALYELTGGTKVSVSDGYVQSVTLTNRDGSNVVLEPYSDANWNYYGWNYCVIRNGAFVSNTNSLSASVVEVQSGDTVVWAFGTTEQASAYFDMILSHISHN